MERDADVFDEEGLDNKSSITEIIRNNLFALFFALLGLTLITVGLFIVIRSDQSEEIIEIIPVQDEKVADKIKTDIEGAVMRPGLYELDFGSRLNDLLITAGGLSARADREWVEKTLNKAQKLKDGDKFYIPEKQEPANNPVISSPDQAMITPVSGMRTININAASLEELDTLYGVGQATAKKIVDNRPYQTVEDLLNKKVVNRSVFDKIQSKITVY